ncbi:hypothetical protein GCM10022276_15800 [Sphingomonas limnosediminicola]|jgi:hypothetical protein|uniref:Sugar transporter n=1 Tax=Sphingomonas limnosediminicola TaxID=940133 RepID=A0ABP7LBS1_9SPHN
MQQAVSARAPAHLWIVGILSFLWNCFGGYDYTMTRLKNTNYLSQMGDPNVILSYVNGMPMYAQIGWGLGVWCALLGSVLLLTRSRYAVHAFAVSLVGALLSFGGQYLGPPPPAEMNSGAMKYVPMLIIALAIAQLWYAWREAREVVLR